MTSDITDKNGSCLKTLLGGSIAKIHAGMDETLLQSPCIVFNSLSNINGFIDAENVTTDVEFYSFKVFANNCPQIIARLRVLMDNYTFTETSEAGGLRSEWDNDGPDLFDEDMKVRRKDCRFRIYSVPKAVGPI